MTSKQIIKIARATKSLPRDGMGLQLVVFADGTILEAVSSHDIEARGSGDGWEYPVARFNRPSTAQEVRRALGLPYRRYCWRCEAYKPAELVHTSYGRQLCDTCATIAHAL